jgi:cytochrome-b5 reductase
VDGEYEPFDLVQRNETAQGHSYFILKRQKPKKYWWAWYEKELSHTHALSTRTPIMSLRIKNPSLQIQRSYTPLNLSSEEIHLVMKRYPNGELSRFLHILTPGSATVWVNQGRQEWIYNEGEWDHIVFVAGGTGITPAFQLCLNALQKQNFRGQVDPAFKKTKFSVLAAARNMETLLLRKEFATVKQLHGEGNLNVKYFLDTVSKGIKLPSDIQAGPITEKDICETIFPTKLRGWFDWGRGKTVVPQEKLMVLVCGPDGFTKYISGEHGGLASKQGVKGGLLKDLEGIEVFKLLESRDDDTVVEGRKEKRGMPIMKVE